MKVRWSRRATQDLIDIGEFIGSDDPLAARRWIERLRDRAALAAVTPLGGRVVPELSRTDVRETYLKSYRIVYRVLPREIIVVTVFEGHRRFPQLDPESNE
jgi:toxin ParE1/3/4